MDDSKSIVLRAINEKRGLLEPQALTLLKSYSIPVPDFFIAKNCEEAVDAAEKVGYPVVMKIVSPDIIHKTDAGCVKLNVKDSNEVRTAFDEIVKNGKKFKDDMRFEGVIVHTHIPKGVEIIVGVTDDAQFGQTVMFGLGGIYVEVLKDVTFRVVPLKKKDAEEMVREIKGYPLLEGIRGEKSKDVEAVVDLIMKVSEICTDFPEIKEIDLNPVFVYEDGLKIIDARILVE